MKAVPCGSCGSSTEFKWVHVTMWQNEQLVVIERVPAQICNACQEQFYDEGTRAAILRLAENGFPKRRVVREMTVPVYSLQEQAPPPDTEPTEVVEGR